MIHCTQQAGVGAPPHGLTIVGCGASDGNCTALRRELRAHQSSRLQLPACQPSMHFEEILARGDCRGTKKHNSCPKACALDEPLLLLLSFVMLASAHQGFRSLYIIIHIWK